MVVLADSIAAVAGQFAGLKEDFVAATAALVAALVAAALAAALVVAGPTVAFLVVLEVLEAAGAESYF